VTLLVPLALIGAVWGALALSALPAPPGPPGAPAAPAAPWSQPLLWWCAVALVAGGAVALRAARSARGVVAALALLACALGLLRAGAVLAAHATPAPLERRLAAGPVAALRGVVAAPPVVGERAQRLRLRVTAVRAPDGPWETLAGAVQVTAGPAPALRAGEALELRGAWRSPETGAPAGYAAVLRRQGVAAVVAFPELTRLGPADGDRRPPPLPDSSGRGLWWPRGFQDVAAFWERAPERARGALAGGLESLLPEPQASLAAGILLGQRSTLPPDLREQLARSGTSHIVAVSGYNVGLVVAAFGTVAAGAGAAPGRRPRRRHRLATIACASLALWAFVALVGASGSVLRAGAMAQLALAGRAFEREGAGGALLLWGSAALLAWRPDLAVDAGWQLSFLGTAGLVWLGPALAGRFAVLPATVREALGATLAAQVFVLPALAVTFGRVSLVAPLSNVLALPLVGPVMLGAALTSVAALLCPPAAPLLAGLTWAPATALLRVVAWTAGLPFAAVYLPPWSPLAVAAYLAVLVALCVARERWLHGQGAPPAAPPPAPAASPAGGRQIGALGALVALSAVGCAMAAPGALRTPAPELHLTVPAVPSGTLVLATAPDGARLLIGGGPTSGGAAALLGESLRPWDRAVDAVLVPDARNTSVQGLPRVVGRYRTGILLEGTPLDGTPDAAAARFPALQDTRSAARSRGVTRRSLAPGSSARIGRDLRLSALGALSHPAWRVEWGTFSLLLPGDPRRTGGWADALDGSYPPAADVLLLDPGGAADPALGALVHAVRPALVIVQGQPAGRHPDLARLAFDAAPSTPGGTRPGGTPPGGTLPGSPPVRWHDTARDGPLRLDVRPGAFRLNGGPWIFVRQEA
jgi:competence protein ComEC